jgi:hypothetical protein
MGWLQNGDGSISAEGLELRQSWSLVIGKLEAAKDLLRSHVYSCPAKLVRSMCVGYFRLVAFLVARWRSYCRPPRVIGVGTSLVLVPED